MDPSIMKKLLEDDEDESMHSGAEVDAFQAALNRDIAGDFPAPQPSASDSAFLAQGSNSASSQSVSMPQYQTANRDDSTNYQIQQDQSYSHTRETNSSGNEIAEQPRNVENVQQQNNNAPQEVREDRQVREATGVQMSGKNPNSGSESQYLKLQKMSNQQATVTEQASKPPDRKQQVPFGLLLPVLINQLDRDKGMQLTELFGKLKRDEISKESFVRLIRGVVGEQMLRLAVQSVQAQMVGQQLDKNQALQAHQKVASSSAETSQIPSLKAQVQPNQAHQISNVGASNQERDSLKGLHKQQPLHFPPTPFSAYGVSGRNSHFYSGTNPNTSALPVKSQSHDSQMRQMSQHQNTGSSQGANILAVKLERQNPNNDSSRMYGGSLPHFASNSTNQQKPVPWQRDQNGGPSSSMSYVKPEPLDQANEMHHRLPVPNSQGLPSVSAAQTEQGSSGFSRDESEKRHSIMGFSNNPSAATAPLNSAARQHDTNIQVGSRAPSGAYAVNSNNNNNNNNNNNKTPPRKPVVGQKKPLEALGSSPPPASKKPKVSGNFLDQSIEQLNDVTAVSGVNLREEEEQLFSGPKEDSRVSEASRKAMQEEEERSLLQKNPLQKKLAEIMAKSGLKCINSDVERCLSLCVEERMRGLIDNLIRLSKQRVDAEKSRHQIITTSDVRLQIMAMNQKEKEEWDKKNAEAEKLRKQNDPESINGVDSDNKEKDDGRGKSLKTQVNKEEDDKMRTTAANVAARAAVGGDDMLSKWQLMAEQAKQKREGGSDSGSMSQTGKDGNRTSTTARTLKDDSEKQGFAHGGAKKFGRNQVMMPQTRVVRRITVKDVVAVLEREPQMSKSTLIYRLYDKIRSDATPE